LAARENSQSSEIGGAGSQKKLWFAIQGLIMAYQSCYSPSGEFPSKT